MATDGQSEPFGAVNLGEQHHICAFFNSMDEEHRVLRSFYRDGFDRGEKATHIVDAEHRDPYLKRLAEDGIDVNKMIDTGQLEVLPWTDMYVRDHRFDQDAMLASVEELIRSGASAGYTHTKLVGHHMDWVFADKPAVDNLLEYEAPQRSPFQAQRSGDLQLRPVNGQCERGDRYHTDAPACDHRWVAAGEPVLHSARKVSGGNEQTTIDARGRSLASRFK